jgi:H+-transporting ATPase
MSGEAYGVVLLTGCNTEIGQAQADVLADKSVRVVSVFQQKTMRIVQIFVVFSLAFVIGVLLVLGISYDGFKEDVETTILAALSILIASIPVALPLVLQVNLALGASFLAKEHSAIVTSIPALQDIASMSILCSDKTGTLTTANMSVIRDRIVATGEFKTEGKQQSRPTTALKTKGMMCRSTDSVVRFTQFVPFSPFRVDLKMSSGLRSCVPIQTRKMIQLTKLC